MTPLVFGDPAGEQALVDTICREHRLGVIETVVLWPCGESVLLSEFIAGGVGVRGGARGGAGKGTRGGEMPIAGAGGDGSSEGGETDSSSSTATTAGDSSSGPAPAPRRRVRLVALDGTYHTSKRQYKHLKATLAAAGMFCVCVCMRGMLWYGYMGFYECVCVCVMDVYVMCIYVHLPHIHYHKPLPIYSPIYP